MMQPVQGASYVLPRHCWDGLQGLQHEDGWSKYRKQMHFNEAADLVFHQQNTIWLIKLMTADTLKGGQGHEYEAV